MTLVVVLGDSKRSCFSVGEENWGQGVKEPKIKREDDDTIDFMDNGNTHSLTNRGPADSSVGRTHNGSTTPGSYHSGNTKDPLSKGVHKKVEGLPATYEMDFIVPKSSFSTFWALLILASVVFVGGLVGMTVSVHLLKKKKAAAAKEEEEEDSEVETESEDEPE